MPRKLRRGPFADFDKPIDDPVDSLFARNLVVQVVQPNRARNIYERLKCLILIETLDVPIMLMSRIEEPSRRFASLNEHQQMRTLNNSYVILRQSGFLQASANLFENIAVSTRFEVQRVNSFV